MSTYEQLRAIAEQNDLVLIVFSKSDVEYAADRSLSDEEWRQIIRRFTKDFDASTISDQLIRLARSNYGTS